MDLGDRLKKHMKLLSLIISIVFAIFIIAYIHRIYDNYYSYNMDDFKKTALTHGYTQLAYHSEYYQIYEDDFHYLVLIKGNSNHYVVQKSAGLSTEDLTKLGIVKPNSLSSLYLVPSSVLVGNTKVKDLNGYLRWRYINDRGEVVYIDYFIEK